MNFNTGILILIVILAWGIAIFCNDKFSSIENEIKKCCCIIEIDNNRDISEREFDG